MKIFAPAKNAAEHHALMAEGAVGPLIVSLSIPTILSMCVSALYNTADTFFVSQLGTSASGAVGVVFSLMAIIQSIGFTLGMGAGNMISRALGAGEGRTAGTYASSAFTLALACTVTLCVIGHMFLDRLMVLLGATPTILPYARSYAAWILYGAPIMCSSFVMNNILRSEGHAAFSMWGLVTGGLINIVLDPIFIFVFNLGISGAAMATILSQCVSFSILLSFFIRGKSIVRLSPLFISRRVHTYLDILRLGLPSLSRQGLAAISTAALNAAAGGWGDAAVAAMSIVGRIFMFIMAVQIGIHQGFAPVSGYNYGSRNYARVRAAYWFAVRFSMTLMAPLACAVWIFAPAIVSRFRPDADVVAIGTVAMRWQCAALLLQPIFGNTNMLLQSTGFAWRASFLACTRQGIFFLPLILTLPRLFGLTGLEMTQAISDLLSISISIPFLIWFMRLLKKKEIAEK